MRQSFKAVRGVGIVITAGLLLSAVGASAQQAGEGWYLGVAGYESRLKDADNRDRQRNVFCDPVLGCFASVNEDRYKTEFDGEQNVGITIGHDYFGPFRAEAEFRYFENDLDRITFRDGPPENDTPSDRVRTRSLMFNFWYDFMNHSRLRPYVGLGVGFARVDFDGLSDDIPVAQAGAGLSFNLTDRFTVDAGYRYTIGASPHYSSRNRAIKSDYEVEHFMVGLRYNFFEGRSAMRDSDGDGVPDHLDRCPGTPRGVEVDRHGCPIDSKGDGIPDYLRRN